MSKMIRNDIYEAKLSENLLSKIRQVQCDVFWERKNREYNKFYVAAAIFLAFITAEIILAVMMKKPEIVDPMHQEKIMDILSVISVMRAVMGVVAGALLGRAIAMAQNYKEQSVNHPITLGLDGNISEYVHAFEYLANRRRRHYTDTADKCELLLLNILARGNFDIKYENGGIPAGNCTVTLVSPDGPGICIESCILPESSQLRYLQWELSDDNEKSVRINPAIKSFVRKKEKEDVHTDNESE